MSSLIALIVDGYAEVKKEESSEITTDMLEKVVKKWTEFDPEGEGFITYENFWKFSGQV